MKRKITVLLLAMALIIGTLTLTAGAEEGAKPLSLGLAVIAEENGMAKAALVGRNINFEAEDFARSMNLSRVDTVVISKVPPVTDGELRVGNTVLTGGETLSATSLGQLTYVPSSTGITPSSFVFQVNGAAVDVTCKLYHLDKINECPTLDGVDEKYLNVSTHENSSINGTLPCHDPDGDKVIIEIVSYPEGGILELTDREKGEYRFTPTGSFSGKDQFTYVARDIYGNYSASKTVSLTVKKK